MSYYWWVHTVVVEVYTTAADYNEQLTVEVQRKKSTLCGKQCPVSYL